MTPEEEKALQEKVNAIEEENKRLASQVSGAETLLQQHKTEMGEARKQITDAMESTKSFAKQEELQKALDKLNEIEQNAGVQNGTGQGGQGATGAQSEPKTLDEAQGQLLKAAKGNPVIDQAWQAMPEEERTSLWMDKEQLSSFVQAAVEAPKPVPGSLLDAAPGKADQGDQSKQRFRDLFKQFAGGSTHLPGSSRAGADGYAGAGAGQGPAPNTQQSKRLPSGAIPRPSGT